MALGISKQRLPEQFDANRRSVLAGLGMTFALTLGAAGFKLASDAAAQNAPNGSDPKTVSAWVRVAPDDRVIIYSAGAEMGQGSLTSLALIVAEEMDADWSKVTVEFAPAEVETYGYRGNNNNRSMAIVGSNAVRRYYPDLRIAGAQVRKVLIATAATHWRVDPATLRTEPNVVVDPVNNRRMSYGAIAALGAMPAALPAVQASELKPRAAFRYIGKPVPRVDIPAKVDGSAQYSLDVNLPGMLYATAVHSPVQGGAPQGWNDAAIKAMPGIRATMALPDGVAIVGDRWERVLDARRALRVTWKDGAKAKGFDSEVMLSEGYAKVHADPNAPREAEFSKGDAAAAFAGAAKMHHAEFRSDFAYHAQMEPLNAVARFSPDKSKVEVWDGSQSPDRTRAAVAEALRTDQANVTVHQCYMGGGFGRRSLGDYAAEAALIGRELTVPVKLIWTREEDVSHGMFRPQAFQCVEAALDAGGNVTGWRHCIVGDGEGLISGGANPSPYYNLANIAVERRGMSHGVRLKHWRAVAHPFNMFAIESLVDELAEGAGMDPIAFRLARMNPTPRARAVLTAVREMSDWTAPRPAGRALGLSMSERSGSIGAGVVEISLDRTSGQVRVHKVWMAVDGGLVVQPDAARANIESGIVWGLSGALYERATMKDGAVGQSNFHDYQIMRMSQMPEVVEVRFVEGGDVPQGLGEIGNPFAGAAVSNAVHRLTGKRLRHMPFTAERVTAALQA